MKNTPNKLVIVDGVRTPFAKFGTSLAGLDATELGRIAVSALVARTGLDPALVSEVIMGCVAQPPDAANVARVIALRAGIPEEVPAMTVQRNCGSGLEALTTAMSRAALGHGDIFIAGGTESMSNIPLYFPDGAAEKFTSLTRSRTPLQRARAATRFRPADFTPVIGLQLGLTDPVSGLNMGQTAEVLAREYGISRDLQDSFALESHRKAQDHRECQNGEIVPVYPPGARDGAVREDNGIRPGQSLEALAKLRPVFDPRLGTVTAGNSSQITDGAVALLLMTEKRAAQLGFEPLGRIVDFAFAGCDPRRMGLGPVRALSLLRERTGVKPAEVDLVEINEAFAAQVLAVLRELEKDRLGFDLERLNRWGGAIALGHPVGASGARLVLTALRQLKHAVKDRALVSLCIGGGQGGAALLERI